jgi:hypothetical protein
VTHKAPHGLLEHTMSPAKRYAKKHAKARHRVVSLSYAANCDEPLSRRPCSVNQPVMRSSIEVSGPRAARLASSRTHLPHIISRSSGSTPAYSAWGCGHGGTRNSSTSRRVQTWSVSPAAMAGVQGRHCVAEPLPLVGAGCERSWRTLAWGKQKSLNLSAFVDGCR